jgi:hypothetical protein
VAAERNDRGGAWRNRVLSGALVACYLTAAAAWQPDALARAELHYRCVLTLGYGHLLGSAVSARAPLSTALRRLGPLTVSLFFCLTTVLLAFTLYLALISLLPSIVYGLLAIGMWHTVENDHMLASIYAPRTRQALVHVSAANSARLGLPRLSRRLRSHLSVLSITAAALCLAGLAVDGPLFADFFAATTLYHVASFLVLSIDRRHRTPRRLRTLLWVHALPAAICAFLLAVPADPLRPLHNAAFSPAIYLFWSLLHVAQTVAVRECAGRGEVNDRGALRRSS